jgi:hypothetical protein
MVVPLRDSKSRMGQTALLAGTILPHAVRDIIYGAVVLVSVLALRER